MIKIFIEFFKIGAFSFGGGLATLPYIYSLAERTEWFSNKDITNMITISQITPGPLACNVATFIGFKLEGVIGCVLANIAFIIPAVIFSGIVFRILDKFKENKKIDNIMKLIRAAALATIIQGSISIFKIAFLHNSEQIYLNTLLSNINIKAIVLLCFLYIVNKKKKIHLIYNMFFSAFIGIIFAF